MKHFNFLQLKILMSFLFVFIFSNVTFAQEDIYEMDLEALMNMEIVSASKQAESLFDAPLAASVVTGEDIKKAGCTSIMEALRLVPGLIVRETTPGNYDIHIRGYDAIDHNALISSTSNTISLVMINNMPVYNEIQGQVNWESFPIGIADIDRIEIVRGPVSAMYGPNAVSGVINILTKNSTEEKEVIASTYTQGGIPNAIITSTNVGYNFGNGLAIIGGFNYDKRDRHFTDYYILSKQGFVDELDDNIRSELGFVPINPDLDPLDPATEPNINERFPNPDLATDRYSGNLQAALKEGDFELNVFGGYSSSDVQRIWAYNQISALTNEKSVTGYSHIWGKYKDLSVSADMISGKQEIVGSGKILEDEYQTMDANIEYDLKITEQFKFKPGASYRKTIHQAYPLGSTKQIREQGNYHFENLYGDITNKSISGFIQAEYKTERFRLIGAMRADQFEYPDKIIFNPLIATTFKASKDFLVRGSYGRSARSPFMMDLFFNIDLEYPIFDSQGNVILNQMHYRGTERSEDIPGAEKSEYQPLIIDDAQIGFRHNISETFQLDIELFWSKISNMVTTATVYQEIFNSLDETVLGAPYRIDTVTSYFSTVSIDAEPSQTGVTFGITSVPFNNLTFQIYATVQETRISNYYDSLDVNGNAVDQDGDGNKYIKEFYHEATPSFYGGVNTNYKPFSKLNINVNSYVMNHQTLAISGNANRYIRQAKGSILLNATFTYEITKNISVFVNGRNLLNNQYRQYAFADKIGASYFGGLKIDL